MSGLTGHVLVYGGRGALGTTVVDFLKNKNYVSCLYIFSCIISLYIYLSIIFILNILIYFVVGGVD